MALEITDLPHPARDDLRLTDVLFALSDPERLACVRRIAEGPWALAQCTTSGPWMSKSAKSHLRRVLREAGVIRIESRGRGGRLSIRHEDLEARFPGLIGSVLGAAAKT